MIQQTIQSCKKQVVITANDEQGPFTSRLYVNNGATATLLNRKSRSLEAAKRQAKKMLS